MKQRNKSTKLIINFLIQQICLNSYCIQGIVLQISGERNMNQVGLSLKEEFKWENSFHSD